MMVLWVSVTLAVPPKSSTVTAASGFTTIPDELLKLIRDGQSSAGEVSFVDERKQLAQH